MPVFVLNARREKKKDNHIFLIISIAVFFILLDQLTKFLARANLSSDQSLPLIKDFFHLTLVYNRGAAFGLFQDQIYLFILTAIVVIILVYLDIQKNRISSTWIYSLAVGLLLAGALGNLIDRIFLGYVIDFIDFRIWPVFNVADSAITVGAVLLGWFILKSQRHKVTKSHL